MSKDSVRSTILRASKGASAELRRKGLPATSAAVAKLGAATFAIGKSVTGWTDDFERAMKGSSPSAPKKKRSKPKKKKKKRAKKRAKKGKRKSKRKGR